MFAMMVLVLAGPAMAQIPPERILAAASQAGDLVFPPAPTPLPSDRPRMGLYKPDGPGPFPGIVLHHQCSGLVIPRGVNVTVLHWAREIVERGYAVLLIDSLGPRDVDTVCMGPKGGVNLFRGVRDALQAAEHLRKFDFVDPKRVAQVGFSWGAIIGLMSASRSLRSALRSERGFAAIVSHYPGCFTVTSPQGGTFEIVNADIDRPILALLGDRDTETPADECMSKLGAANSTGAPVQWHLFADATHCWDCENLDGFSKISFRGAPVTYRYDRAIATEAGNRMFEFLDRTLAAER
jgi:dienelactone hydrolase